jgi:putative glutamine amidotransferase
MKTTSLPLRLFGWVGFALTVGLADPATATPTAAQSGPPTVVLLTHPRASVLHYYVTLVRQGILKVDNLQLLGIHHSSEKEDYDDAQAYLDKEKIDFIRLKTIDCPLHPEALYNSESCRPAFAEVVNASSGIILNGGPDIPPSMYGESTMLTTVIETPHRHQFELAFLAHLLGTARNPRILPLLAQRPDYAVMAICVGMQSLNVADGGSLYQDIPSELYAAHTLEQIQQSDPGSWHRNGWAALDPEPVVAAGVFHPIRLTSKAPAHLRMLADNQRTVAHVLSIHHQAVKRLGENYAVTATSLDGKVVEGIRHRRFANVLGWQFHPERPVLWDKTEIGRMNEAAPDSNFAYTTLQKDGASRAFALAIWQDFARALASSQAHPH